MTSPSPHPQFPAASAGPMGRGHQHGWLGVAGVIAFGLAFAASLVLLFLPVYSTVTTISKGVTTQDTVTLWAANGPWILVPLTLLVLLTSVFAIARCQCGLLCSILCMLCQDALTMCDHT